jgi:hypothetical protein
MASLFEDAVYNKQRDAAWQLLDINSPQRKQAMDVAQQEVSQRYAKAGLTGSGQELQAVQDTARDLTFNQTIQAMNASQVPVSNWLAAEQLKQAQKTGDIQLMGQALAALGIPAALAKSLFGIDTTPRYVIGGKETPSTGGLAGDLYRYVAGPGGSVAATGAGGSYGTPGLATWGEPGNYGGWTGPGWSTPGFGDLYAAAPAVADLAPEVVQGMMDVSPEALYSFLF